jgi:hypothetical protein
MAGVAPRDAIYVGDLYEIDAIGSRAAGLHGSGSTATRRDRDYAPPMSEVSTNCRRSSRLLKKDQIKDQVQSFRRFALRDAEIRGSAERSRASPVCAIASYRYYMSGPPTLRSPHLHSLRMRRYAANGYRKGHKRDAVATNARASGRSTRVQPMGCGRYRDAMRPWQDCHYMFYTGINVR